MAMFSLLIAFSTICMQDVAIKQMKDTKSKEFMSELNILCRVHHSNLVSVVFACLLKDHFSLEGPLGLLILGKKNIKVVIYFVDL